MMEEMKRTSMWKRKKMEWTLVLSAISAVYALVLNILNGELWVWSRERLPPCQKRVDVRIAILDIKEHWTDLLFFSLQFWGGTWRAYIQSRQYFKSRRSHSCLEVSTCTMRRPRSQTGLALYYWATECGLVSGQGGRDGLLPAFPSLEIGRCRNVQGSIQLLGVSRRRTRFLNRYWVIN